MRERNQEPNYAQIRDELYDLAVSRHLEQSDFDCRDYLTDEERLQYDEAVLFTAAQPAPDIRTIGKVVIEVLGGVAYVTSQPDEVQVEIIDHDNDNEEHGGFAPGVASALDHFLEKADMPQDRADSANE